MTSDSRYISDAIQVNVIPEKKGTFLKHTEYEVRNCFVNNCRWLIFVVVDNVGETQKQGRATL